MKHVRVLLAHLVRSPALRAAAVLAAGGIGFALATLLLARVLEPEEFGRISLFLALVQLGMGLGPLGIELSINRNRLQPSRRIATRVMFSTLSAGVVLSVTALMFYDQPPSIALCVGLAAVFASLNRVGTAFLQVQARFTFSLVMGQVHNYVLLLAGVLLVVINSKEAITAVLLMVCSYTVAALVSWRSSVTAADANGDTSPNGPILAESLAGVGMALATQILWQLERLVIPQVLTLEDLALFAVVASIGGSAFRVLYNGVGHTLLPRLRGATTNTEARWILVRESMIVCGMSLLAAVGVLIVTPFVVEIFLRGQYPVSMSLLVAIVISGVLKVLHGFANSAMQAFAETSTLVRVNIVTAIAVIMSVIGAGYGGRFGITGIVYGGSVGWLVMLIAACVIARASFRRRFGDAADLRATTNTPTPASIRPQ